MTDQRLDWENWAVYLALMPESTADLLTRLAAAAGKVEAALVGRDDDEDDDGGVPVQVLAAALATRLAVGAARLRAGRVASGWAHVGRAGETANRLEVATKGSGVGAWAGDLCGLVDGLVTAADGAPYPAVADPDVPIPPPDEWVDRLEDDARQIVEGDGG